MDARPVIRGLLDPGSGQGVPAVLLHQDQDLGLVVQARCPAAGDDAGAAVHVVLNALVNQLSSFRDDLERHRAGPGDGIRKRLLEGLEEAVRRAEVERYAFARRRKHPLPVALDVLLLAGPDVLVAHVGDGQAYLLRRDLLHRLARPPLAEDRPHPALAEPDPGPSLLGEEGARVQVFSVEAWPGDRLVLASAELAAALGDGDVRVVAGHLEAEAAPEALVLLARERGATAALGVTLVALPGSTAGPSDQVLALLPVLARMPLFAWLDNEELLDVAAVALPRRVGAGTILLREGEGGGELYLLVDGGVDVRRGGAVVARLGPGSTFGEMAMLDEPRRSASIQAASDVELLVLTRDDFTALLRANPTLAVKVLWNLVLRLSGNLRRTTALLAEVAPDRLPPT